MKNLKKKHIIIIASVIILGVLSVVLIIRNKNKNEEMFQYYFSTEAKKYISEENVDYEKLIPIYTKALSYAPNSAKAFLMRSLAYSSIGKYDEALSDIEMALRNNGKYDAQEKLALSILYEQKGEILNSQQKKSEATLAYCEGVSSIEIPTKDDMGLVNKCIGGAIDTVNSEKAYTVARDFILKSQKEVYNDNDQFWFGYSIVAMRNNKCKAGSNAALRLSEIVGKESELYPIAMGFVNTAKNDNSTCDKNE